MHIAQTVFDRLKKRPYPIQIQRQSNANILFSTNQISELFWINFGTQKRQPKFRSNFGCKNGSPNYFLKFDWSRTKCLHLIGRWICIGYGRFLHFLQSIKNRLGNMHRFGLALKPLAWRSQAAPLYLVWRWRLTGDWRGFGVVWESFWHSRLLWFWRVLCVVSAFKIDIVLAWFDSGFGVEYWCDVGGVCDWFWRFRFV